MIAESLEELDGLFVTWKDGIESKGLQVNISKT